MSSAVFLDAATLGDDVDLSALATLCKHFESYQATADHEVLARCEHVSAVFTNKVRFDAATLRALPSLRYIGLTATGTDIVDLRAAADAGIAVSNITAYCTQSVVQHVFAVLLQLTHRLPDYIADVRAGRWSDSSAFCLLDHPIRELAGLTMVIVGYGELGRAVAQVAGAFGMRVLITRRNQEDTRTDRVALTDALAQADVVSLHCPLNDSTRQMINAQTLALMKSDCVLINTARGGLIDSHALLEALQSGALAGAALDVLDIEPPPAEHPLLTQSLPNLIITPHIAWAAREARQRAIQQTADHYAAFLAGQSINRVESAI
ncbi:MAG: D-2-hydroxyacid dehydrogenase [Pseudomonadota bacterium]